MNLFETAFGFADIISASCEGVHGLELPCDDQEQEEDVVVGERDESISSNS